MTMKFVSNKLQVCHFAQVPCTPFIVDVTDEQDAYRIMNILARQHLFLEEEGIIPDYSNVICVRMWDDTLEPDENGEKWSDYWNEEECMDWDEFEVTYLHIPGNMN